ncbi:S-layer homology domain-containing protein [Paenibacillus oryzisoli]|uniref:SLH domain-containing protein n=1 Tax=Paenibacillus oryzisoli TaxID=1850517 RepID=A0A198AM73_9BACL|nr:S-layer homology domain-containing protein [Paenibacillus oryzisoli]OAS22106.1 hypothetical protein A8708_33575 [Paenibacillus oryzisoli]
MVISNDDNEVQVSKDRRTSLKKYSKVARASMMAITMGMSLNPAYSTAASVDNPSSKVDQQISLAAPVQYTGNSLDYFKNVFLPKSSFHALGGGETAPTATNVAITGNAMVGQTLTGVYSYDDAEDNIESGTSFQWYRSNDPSQLGDLIASESAKTYILTSTDVGKYITFVVTPRTTVAPTDGLETKSAPTAAIAAAPQPEPEPSNTDTPEDTTPKPEESLIEVVALQQNVETQASAKLTLTKDQDGVSLANFHFLKEGVVQSSQAANKKETIAVRAKTLMKAKTVYADITGDVISTLIANQQRLAVQTGDVATEFPTVSIPIADMAKQSGVTADKLKIEIKIEKQPEAVKENGNQWAATHNATVIGEPYKFTVEVNDGSVSKPIVQYGNRYAYQTVPIPDGVTNLNSLGAIMLLDGKYVTVPVRIVDATHALIHTPTNTTVMLIQRNTNFADVASHWGKDDIHLMADKGNVVEDAQGKYNPDKLLTRAEFADLLVKSLGLGHQQNATKSPQFSDLPSDPTLQESIRIAAADGLFNGISDGIFAPNAIVTREQMITVLMRFYKEFELDTRISVTPPTFSDESQLSDWAEDDVYAANRAGIIDGYENVTVRPQRTGTRAEATALMRRFLQKTNLTN